MLLQGHVALITGSGRNIGASIARSFAREGADIVVNVRSSVAEGEETVRAVRALGRKATLIVADVTDSRQVRAMAEQAARELGVIDILVNSAGGYGKLTGVEELPVDDWDRTVTLNLRGTFLMCKRAIPYLKKSKAGRIINVSSISGRTLFGSTSPAYAASKAGVIQLTRFLAIELGPSGITSNSIAPITTLTPRVKALRTEANIQQIASQIPLRRLPDPEDHANAMVFLASDAAAYLNGVSLDINGGRILM